MEPIYATIGSNIKRLRTLSGCTQERLSEDCGLSQNFISQLESGRKKPSLDVLTTLAGCLRVPVYCLLKPDPDKKDSCHFCNSRISKAFNRLRRKDRELINHILVFLSNGKTDSPRK